MGRRASTLALQSLCARARALCARLAPPLCPMSTRVVTRSAATSLFGRGALAGRGQVDAGAPGLRQADGDRLLRRARTVLAAPDVLHLFAHELSGLRGRSLALASVAPGSFDGAFLWHVGLRLVRIPTVTAVFVPWRVPRPCLFSFVRVSNQASGAKCPHRLRNALSTNASASPHWSARPFAGAAAMTSSGPSPLFSSSTSRS